MKKASGLARGDYIVHNGKPMMVQEREFVKPGKGSAFVRLKLRDCADGSVHKETVNSELSMEEAAVEKIAVQYLYNNGSQFVFIDSTSFEQMEVGDDALSKNGLLLQEGGEYQLIRWEDTIIDIELPYKVAYEVLYAEEATRGNTVSGATKVVRIQNDVEIRVPLFIKQGDNIIINTRTLEYVERAK